MLGVEVSRDDCLHVVTDIDIAYDGWVMDNNLISVYLDPLTCVLARFISRKDVLWNVFWTTGSQSLYFAVVSHLTRMGRENALTWLDQQTLYMIVGDFGIGHGKGS